MFFQCWFRVSHGVGHWAFARRTLQNKVQKNWFPVVVAVSGMRRCVFGGQCSGV